MRRFSSIILSTENRIVEVSRRLGLQFLTVVGRGNGARRVRSAFPINRNRCSMDYLGLSTAEEQYYLGDLLRFGPFGKISARHGFAIGFGVNDAGQNGIDANAQTFHILRQAIKESEGGGF